MKRALLAVALCLGLTTQAHAEPLQTVALIDSAVNASLFPNNVVTEVCAIEYSTCPNGKQFQESAGVANLVSTNAEINHGNEMMSIMVKVNPNIKVIPIRIVGMTSTGNPYIYTLDGVKTALDWVVANRVKYNISVVSLSQGKVFSNCGGIPAGMAEDLATLKANNVQFVAATGNDANRTAMFSPACLADAISVGATDNPDPGSSGKTWSPTAPPTIATYSNGNTQTTVYSNARYIVTELSGKTKFMVGTSNATAAVASWLTLNKGSNWTTTYNNLIASASGTATNKWLTGRYLFINS
jgi:hypothetical protein